MDIFVISNKKGGVGKTTTAFNLAEGLQKRGKRVVAIDLDPQGNLTHMTGLKISGPTSFGVLMGEARLGEAYDWSGPDAVPVVPASPALATADQTLPPGIGRNMRLKEALDTIKDDFDFCIIDTPPAIGIVTINAFVAADFVIIPAEANELSTEGIISVYESVKDVRKYANRRIEISGILLTRYRSNTSIAKEYRKVFERLASKMNTVVYETPIRESIAFSEIPSIHKSIFDYKPRSGAAKDYNALIDNVLGISREKAWLHKWLLEKPDREHETDAEKILRARFAPETLEGYNIKFDDDDI